MKFSFSLSALLAGTTVLASPVPVPAPLMRDLQPGIPSAATARTQLAGLTVAALGPQTGYSRDLFPHWHTVSGACNTRETVLIRDGTNVVTSSACAATSGTWVSPFDGARWTAASDVDIDHMVPLSNAWKSPDAWKPPLTSFYCTYARSWVAVKSYWALTITSAEKTALTSMLNTC
ncbi:hypothetical protein BN1723_006150 [Verticillium longisporum]|uniref:DUF1524 domain-containing protein n=1 Tax=Verticillium longisporum TaxID=100787 RepID=A0A0G4NDK0_VERLO|nr:hypothetical protein BN1723_006150 [Verticillium longisporum]